MANPCIACGACCAYYRVAFYWAEAEPFLGGRVPAPLTVKLDPHRLAMAGTLARPARCTALGGTIGEDVRCSIYAERPSPCRELRPAGLDGGASEQCDRARRAHGLPPLTADDWVDPLEPQGPPARRVV